MVACYTTPMSLRELKSGSDIRGTAIATAGEVVNLSAEVVKKIGGAFCHFLMLKLGKTDISVAVGHDSRLTGESFKDSLVSKFKECGITIYDCGLASTPSMYCMAKNPETNADGAIMITASHHPFHKNGLKFFTKDGGLTGADIDQLLSFAEQDIAPTGCKTALFKKPYVQRYYASSLVDFVRNKTGKEFPLEGFKIVVDAGNGAGGFFVDFVLRPLGADTTGSQFLEPDGMFPNHMPNPEDAVAMASIKDCVVKNNADLGIIFDTDVDRCAIVAKGGVAINRSSLIALVSAVLLNERKGSYIVCDSVATDGARDFVKDKQGFLIRYKRGYQNVISFAKILNGEGLYCPLAIETSGHCAFLENDWQDDGAYLAVRLLVEMARLKAQGKELTDLIKELKVPKSEFEGRILFEQKAGFKDYGNSVLKNLSGFISTNFRLEDKAFEGVRGYLDFAEGSFILRMSVHDPNMVLNIESYTATGAKQIAKVLYTYLSTFCNLAMPSLAVFSGVANPTVVAFNASRPVEELRIVDNMVCQPIAEQNVVEPVVGTQSTVEPTSLAQPIFKPSPIEPQAVVAPQPFTPPPFAYQAPPPPPVMPPPVTQQPTPPVISITAQSVITQAQPPITPVTTPPVQPQTPPTPPPQNSPLANASLEEILKLLGGE